MKPAKSPDDNILYKLADFDRMERIARCFIIRWTPLANATAVPASYSLDAVLMQSDGEKTRRPIDVGCSI